MMPYIAFMIFMIPLTYSINDAIYSIYDFYDTTNL